MKFKSIARKEDVSRLRKDKIKTVAIDLGFSGNNKTTGFASSTKPAGDSFNFGDAVKKIESFAKTNGDFVLILEAPLCGRFKDGNPVARGDFEKTGNGNKSPKNWNIGAGAAVALAAVHFLIQLQTALAGVKVTVHLLEGFISGHNKPKNSSSKSNKKIKEEQHGLDAALLLQSFSEAPLDCFIKLEASHDILSTTKILDPDSNFPPPLILKPKPSAS